AFGVAGKRRYRRHEDRGQVAGRGAGPALALRGEAFELAAAVQLPELGVAADRSAVDQDLRDRPAAGQLHQPAAELGVVVERDLLEGDLARLEERLGADAVAAPERRVHLDVGHGVVKRGNGHGIPGQRPLYT